MNTRKGDFYTSANIRVELKRNTAGDFQVRAHARALDTESMTIATAVVTARVVGAFELEAEVLLTASAQSLEDETTETTAMTAAGAMTVMTETGTTIAKGNTTAMTAADAGIGAETAEDLIVATRSTRNMTTSPNLILEEMDLLLFSAGRRLRRGGTLEHCYRSNEEMNV